MRVCAIAAVVLVVLATGDPVDGYLLSGLAPQTPTTYAQSPGSTPTSVRPTPFYTSSHVKDGLELRQAPGFAPVAAPPPELVAPAVLTAAPPAPANLPAAVPPAAALPAADLFIAPAAPAAAMPPAMPPANQADLPAPAATVPPATTTIPLPPPMTGDDFVTVQWIETHIGTLRTWIPKTQTFHFEAMSQAPLPGVGGPVGMGTLTGKTGQTQTIIMVVGAAPTPAVDSRKAIAAAVAIGIAGLVV